MLRVMPSLSTFRRDVNRCRSLGVRVRARIRACMYICTSTGAGKSDADVTRHFLRIRERDTRAILTHLRRGLGSIRDFVILANLASSLFTPATATTTRKRRAVTRVAAEATGFSYRETIRRTILPLFSRNPRCREKRAFEIFNAFSWRRFPSSATLNTDAYTYKKCGGLCEKN